MTVVVCPVGLLDPKTLEFMNMFLVLSLTTRVVLVGAVMLLVVKPMMGRWLPLRMHPVRLHGMVSRPVVLHILLLCRLMSL